MRTTEDKRIRFRRDTFFVARTTVQTGAVAPVVSAESVPPETGAEFGRGLGCYEEESLAAPLCGLHARLEPIVQAGRKPIWTASAQSTV